MSAPSPALIERPGAMRERSVSFDGEDWVRLPSGLMVPPEIAPIEPDYPIGIGLFAGAGGFDLGMHQAGFHMAAASDFDVLCCMTYLANLGGPETRIIPLTDEDDARLQKAFTAERRRVKKAAIDEAGELVEADGGWSWTGAGYGWIKHARQLREHKDNGTFDERMLSWNGEVPNDYARETNDVKDEACLEACEVFFLGDARKLTGEIILHELGLEVGEPDAVVGGPPCQGFSFSGKRQVMDPRNSLVFEFARLVVEMKPKTMVMENVEGITSMKTIEGLYVVDALSRILEDGGMGTYDALRRSLGADSKARAVIRGTNKPTRKKNSEPKPAPTHSEKEQLAMQV